MFKIEKNIPIPPSKGGQPPLTRKYPWAEMELEDSFLVRIPMGVTPETIRKRMSRAGNNWCQKNQPLAMVKTRVWDADHIRVWKTKRDDVLD